MSAHGCPTATRFADPIDNELPCWKYNTDEGVSKIDEKCMAGKNVLVDMLQQEIVKKETQYKDLIDKYENLRFKHCSVVQEYNLLKQIYKKLEEEISSRTTNADNCVQGIKNILKSDLEIWMKQYNNASNKLKQKLIDAENILQNKNVSCAEVTSKYLLQIRNLNTETNNKSDKQTETVLGPDRCEIENLKQSNALLTATVDKLKSENKKVTGNLKNKEESLENCIFVLEKNQKDIESLSENINILIKERDNYWHEASRLKLEIEENRLKISEQHKKRERSSNGSVTDFCTPSHPQAPKSKTENIGEIINVYRTTLNSIQKEIEKFDVENCVCTCTLELFIKTLDANTDFLNDFLLTLENKDSDENATIDECSQLKTDHTENDIIVDNLRKELKECKLKLGQLEREVSVSNVDTQTNSQQMKLVKCSKIVCGKVRKLHDPVETSTKTNKTDNLIPKTKRVKCCQTVLQDSQIEKDLETAQSEITEYEEENKCCRQKIELLMKKVEALQEEKNKTEQLCSDYSHKIELLNREYSEQTCNKDEIIKALKEDLNISKQIKCCKCCLVNTSERLSNAFKDLDNIQEQLSNDFYDKKYLMLKVEHQTQTIAEFQCQANSEGTSDNLQETVAQLKRELCESQSLVCRLENWLDRSSEMLSECEQEIFSLLCTNESLKNQLRECYICKCELEEYQQKNADLEKRNKKQLEEYENVHNKIMKLSEEYNNLLNEFKQVDEKLEELKKGYKQLQKCPISSSEDCLECGCDEEIVCESPSCRTRLQITKKSDEVDAAKRLNSISTADSVLVENHFTDHFSPSNPSVLNYEACQCYSKTDSSETIETSRNESINELYSNAKLQQQLKTKEQNIKNLESDKVSLIVQLNTLHQTVQTIVKDNSNLKNGVGLLLTDVIEKLQKLSKNEDEHVSAVSLTQEILKSLTDMKGALVDQKCSCCPSQRCNCMRIINSKYFMMSQNQDQTCKQIKSLYISPKKSFTSTDYIAEHDNI